MKVFLLLVLVGYVLYVLIVRPIVIVARFGKDKTGIRLPEGIDDSIQLMEALREKGFTYPELKNMRHNELGQVVIEGKYTSHALILENGSLFVDRGRKGRSRKQANCIMEAVVIGHYITKLFNPNAPVDAYKEYKSFARRRWQPVVITALLFLAYLIPAAFLVKDSPQLNSHNISESYLSEYSSKTTVGKAFEKYFGQPKWKSYEQGIQKYVDFQGQFMLDNKPAIAVITFSISNEQFRLESIKVNNDELQPSDVKSFMQTVYSDSTDR